MICQRGDRFAWQWTISLRKISWLVYVASCCRRIIQVSDRLLGSLALGLDRIGEFTQ